MRFLIISHTLHKRENDKFFAYGPYIREMNLWLKHVSEVEIVSPFVSIPPSKIDLEYIHNSVHLNQIPKIEFTSIKKILWSIFRLPKIFYTIFNASKRADHIHLRCPGNIGLLGCLVQVIFPNKTKTVKYAGNWDPKSKQPLSYKFQKWILKNEFLTRKTKVLVYGDWKESSKNIYPFFTASYYESKKNDVKLKTFKGRINLLFVGSLSKGKQPLLTIKVANELIKKGFYVRLNIYGEGKERQNIENHLFDNNLNEYVFLHGNQSEETVKAAYVTAHFLIFISKSEGWPKVVAEAMWWNCLPIASNVSCVPEMLGYGERGSIVEPNIEAIVDEFEFYLKNPSDYYARVKKAAIWSRNYTLDKFENEIKKFLR